MFKNSKKTIEQELSGKQAYRYAERIAQYHRIQASTGYRDAANEVIKFLHRDLVNAELVSYPVTFGNHFLSQRTFKEWHCQSAELWIESPSRERIARFEEEEISLVQRSISTPIEGVSAELVVVENAMDETSYEHIDVRGKILLVQGNQFIIHALAIEKYGAAGLIFENLNDYPPVRTRMDMPDTRQYTSYWWYTEEEAKSFGFVVSPRIGEKLKKLAATSTVQLHAHVDAKLYDGHIENIEYFIPGKKKEEILLVSHLCHPYPGGQDNASGPGTLMEVMRTLTKLIEQGKLSEPELGIRFLMMPEMNGTFAYFEHHKERIPFTVAALNLDMVGASQAKGGGPICVEQPPMAMPTFLDRYLLQLLEEVANNTSTFSQTTTYSTFHSVHTRFSGGSDHYIISDPTIGIPCPMIIQWPDKNYHTTDDSPYNLDPNMMKLIGTSTALYVYGLANGTEEEWISYLFNHTGKSSTFFLKSKEWVFNQGFSKQETSDAMTLFIDYEHQSLQQLKKYAELRGFSKLVELTEWAGEVIQKGTEPIQLIAEKQMINQSEKEQQPVSTWSKKVYTRTHIGPICVNDHMKHLSVEERIEWLIQYEEKAPLGHADFLFYWMDGKRSVEEILMQVKLETGMYHSAYTEKLMEICLELGLICEV